MAAKQSEKDSAVKQFFKANKSLVFMIPLLIVLLVVLVTIYTSGSGSKNASSVAQPSGSTPSGGSAAVLPVENQFQVEVLPILERAAEGEEDSAYVSQDPFKTPMKLKGVVIYPEDERSKAIIQYGNYSYIVKKGDNIGDSPWSVSEINESGVTITYEDKSVFLELNQESAGS